MSFKQNWETTDTQTQVKGKTIEAMLERAFPSRKLFSHQLIAKGCSNLTYKICFKDEEKPYILRIYLRDQSAAFREKNLAALLERTVPIPRIYCVNTWDTYRFALTQYIPGISLRDLLLGKKKYDLHSVMFDVGAMLAHIQKHTFSKPGFFNAGLQIENASPQFDMVAFAKKCMQHKNTLALLKEDLLLRVDSCLSTFKHCFPDDAACSLVHGDFDPANIQVNNEGGQWRVTGVLDWEFSFSGSPLWDIANMLRYAHEMPALFETFFLKGVTTGYRLPVNWRISIHLLNVVSLLDCLVRSSLESAPNRCRDICALLVHITTQLENSSA